MSSIYRKSFLLDGYEFTSVLGSLLTPFVAFIILGTFFPFSSSDIVAFSNLFLYREAAIIVACPSGQPLFGCDDHGGREELKEARAQQGL